LNQYKPQRNTLSKCW